jgi:hypothetical protein
VLFASLIGIFFPGEPSSGRRVAAAVVIVSRLVLMNDP